MDFFSKKTGERVNKPIFRALKPLQRCFGRISTFVRGNTLRHIAVQQKRASRFIPYGLLLVSVFLLVSYAESSVELTRKIDTIHIFPEQVVGAAWKNKASLNEQDVNSDGIYQHFTTNNSAYLGRTPESVNDGVEEIGTNNTGEVVDDIVAPIDSEEGSVIEVPVIPNDEPLEIDAPADEAPVDDVSFESDDRDPLYAFVTKITTTLPFAQEVLTEPIVDTDTTDTGMEESIQGVGNESSEAVPLNDSDTGTESVVSDAIELAHEQDFSANEFEGGVEHPLLFTGFAVPPLASGQFITNVQMRMSFGAQYDVDLDKPLPVLDVEYSFGNNEWENAGTILVDSEVSNALNGGYYLFALPLIEDVSALEQLSVRVVYRGDDTRLTHAFIDALWLEMDTETYDRDLLRERVLPETLEYLELPAFHTLISDELDFARTESPHFTLRYESQRNFAIRFLRDLFARNLASVENVTFIHADAGRVDIQPQIDITADGLLTIQLSDEDTEKMQPGMYTVELTMNEGGKLFTDTLEFQWGMLALNPDQTEYEVGDIATISLGALSPGGNTLCDADLQLYIIDPQEFITRVPVLQSGQCNGNNVTDVADYTASLMLSTPGVYEMYVEHLDEDGVVRAHTSDTFKVEPQHDLWITRTGPTRIYPQAAYPMQIMVTAKEAFMGVLTERVPGDFVITATDARITEVDGEYELSWDIRIAAGDAQTFSYMFDAPDISPFLYSLGPAYITDENDVTIVNEMIPQEPEEMLLESVTSSIDEGSIDLNTDTEVPAQHDAIPVPEEAAAETPVVETSTTEAGALIDIVESEESGVVPEESTPELAAPVPTPEEIITEPAALSTPVQTGAFVEHRVWQIASDATGSMIVFWTDAASIPSGWTCISCSGTTTFYNRFPLGGSAYGTTGGTPTTTHTADGSVNQGTGVNAENNGTGSDVSIEAHTHTITPTIGATTTLPAYRQLRVIQSNSAGTPATIPAGALLIFDGTLPAGWTRYTALDDRYPMGQNTIVSSSTNTHVHTVTGTTSAAGGTTALARTNGTTVTASPSTHTHTLSTSTAPVNHEPAFIEVVFATSSSATATPLNAITMWSDAPPAGWLDRSSASGKPFYNRYIKGAATYGTTGGAETHTHSSLSASSSAPIGTAIRRSGTVGSNGTHAHPIDVSNFSSASNTPPYVTVIYAKYYGLIPIYDQFAYRWYSNANPVITPTDPWPTGTDDVDLSQPIDSSLTPVKSGDVVRLRMQLNVSNSTTTGENFKLQFGTTTDLCTAVGSWTDVGASTSSVAWIGYDNAGLADGSTLSSSTITGTDIFESYEESNPTVVLPNAIGIGQDGEWDFVLKQNGAEEGTNYCFRMVESDGTELFTYTEYPKLITNEAPNTPTLSKLFDNEKTGTTTPKFEFTATDPEANDLSYQIEIDDDRTFASVNVDKNTVANGTQFTNLNTPADKDPYTNGETIRFSLTSPLTNGVTYYWRVRAQDSTGSNTLGSWSAIYSFTIDTSVTASTWFQTTEEQFDTDTLTNTDALATDLVQLATGSTTGTTTSSAIDFLDGTTGNAWGSLAWTDTETSSDLKYRLQYYDEASASWVFVPESALSGNAVGFDTSPASLLTLDVETYRTLRVLGVFTNAGASPVLSDWTIAWGYRVDTPTNNAPFANEKVSTTTPIFEFVTTDPQSDALVYEIQWSTTYDFAASTTRNSASSTGFVNITNGANVSPFTSGDTIQFTTQSADALTNGTTYWWRVRARDPLGSNEYSFYTDPQSFTVDTSVTVSTWFQTTASQFDTDILSGALTLAANTVTVATTSNETLIAYAEGNITTPRYRVWDGSLWGAESDALDVGAAIPWVVTRSAPSENEYILATMGTDADVNVQVYKNGSWDNLQEITTSIPNTAMRGFDVAYEQSSGDAMIVSCDGDADPTYYIWNGSSWTNGGAIGRVNANTCGWVKLIANPVSDEIIAIVRDTAGVRYEARVWNGSSWGNSATLGSMTTVNHEGIAAEYEESGGEAVIVTSDGNNSAFAWRSWNGSSWTATATQALGDDFESGSLVADDGSDLMALCYHDEDGDIGAVRWTGSVWTGQTELETLWTNGTAQFNDRPVDCAFEVGGARDGYITVVYSDTTNLRYRTWNGATWAVEASVSTVQDGPRVQVRRTGDNLLQAILYDNTNDRYDYSYWNGTTWSAFQTLEADGAAGATPYKEPFMVTAKNPTTVGSVVGDPGIDFYAGSGPYWQQMSWTDTEPGGSGILYQVEYYDGDSWELVPDLLIPSNSSGITTSPIDLTGVLPASTYSMVRPVANMSCSGGSCPTLSDWTITWSAGITISGTAQAFDQSSNVISGTVAVAVNGVLQTGKTGSISGGSWSIANVNVSPGDIVTVFVNGASDASEAVATARYDGVGNMTGLRLYEQHLTLGSDDATTTAFTNTNLGVYDYTNDEDIFFDVTGSSLDMCADAACGDSELYINASSTYTPGGVADLNNVEINGNFTMGTSTIYVSRSWDNNGTTTAGTSHVIFTATSTTESIDETGALTPSFNNLTFGTTTGSATWNLVTPLDVNGNLNVTRGTLARGTTAMTIAGSLTTGASGLWTGIGTTTFDGTVSSVWTDQNGTLQNIGRAVVDGTSKTITLGSNVLAQSVTVGADDILDVSSSNYSLTLYTNWINNNTFVCRNGTVYFAATTTNRIITAGSDPFYNLNFTGVGGSWSFTESDLSITNDLTIATGTVTMPTGTTTITGSFTNSGGTFAHNNGAVVMNASSAKTLTLGGTAFTNAFYDLRFAGSGSWSFTESSATTSNNFFITQGTVTLPSGILSVGGNFTNSGGTFTHNSGTVRMTGTGVRSIDTNASFSTLSFTGSGSFSFVDANVTLIGSLLNTSGTVTLPSGTLTLGGSYTNSATIAHNNGTVLFNSTDTGETINLGASSLYTMTMNGVGGGWTITEHATATNNFSLSTSSLFTLASGKTLSVGGVFTNSVGGASTTWTGSTLSLEAGAYSINTKTNAGDTYDTLRVKASTDIQMWNSSATTYTIDALGSLYSQDHNGVDGDLYIFGGYERAGGTEYWSYATDFDGTLLGGGSRQVDVRFASGASALLTGSTLAIVGTSTGSTTIANQGSGTYTLSVTNGTTTAQYYDFTNLGSSGLTLAGTTKVTALSDGRFVPGVALGSGITVASSTIDANPQLQIYRVNFSTTTAIAAYNVSQTGGAPASYWWFRESAGNIDGEAFDNDTGDPGSVRWDDSSLTITVSGKVYAADETTALGAPTCGAGTPVRIVVEGGATYDGACDGSGNYSISGVVIVGDPTLTVFLNGAAGGERAVTVTKTPTTNITNLDLIANRVIVRHEDVDAMTIADMAIYDAGDDSDVLFTAATGTVDTLSIQANNELHIWATSTFTPGGSVAVLGGGTGNAYDGSLHIDNGATFTGAGTTTYTIGGILTQDAGGLFIPASTTVSMNATTSGKAIVSATGETVGFNTLEFVGVGGSWNLSGNISASTSVYVATGTVTGTGNITITSGSFYGNGLVSLGTGTTTLSNTNTLGGTQGWTLANLVLGNGSVTGTTTPGSNATTTLLGKLTISTGHYLDAGSSVWDFQGAGTVFAENGTFLEDTSTVRYSGTAGSNILSTNYYDLRVGALGSAPTFTGTGLGIVVLNNLYVGGVGTTTLSLLTSDPALDVNGNVVIAQNGIFIASDTGVFTVGGSWDNDGVFTASGGTVTFDSAGTKTIASGNSSWSTVAVNGAGTFTIGEHATATAAFTINAAGTFTVDTGVVLAVGGTFTNNLGGASTVWTGSTLYLYGGGNYQINASTTSDSYNALTVGSNTDIRMWNSVAGITTVDTTGSLYSQDHNGVDGALYVYGEYVKTSGTDYWSYARDFDGTLLSGAERKVDVYFASSSSALYTGGGLSVVGAPAASTTLQNQGGGTYGLRIGGTASTSMSYYEVRNTNASGIVFSGTPTVVTLSYGDYVVSQPGGSALTVGGSVITQNAAKTFTNNYFGTSTGISAFNVTATGTTVSSWRFTNHAGSIDGESFDVDPDGDPGYIVWDDSATVVAFSGRVYSDEGSSVSGVCDGSTSNIHLRVQGLTSYTTSCDGGGLYTFTGVTYSPGDSLMVYIDGETEKAAVVTEDPVTSIGNLDLYENRVIVRHESADPISIADMALWDSSDDADIPFTAVDGSPDTLTLPANHKLVVWDGKTFTPGGNITLSGGGGGAAYDGTLELFANAAFNAGSGEAHSIGGSFISGAGATFNGSTATLTFTTSAAARTIDTNDAAFYNLTLNGSGSWTVTNTTLSVGNDFVITNGTLTAPGATTTVAGSFSNTGGSFVQNGGHMVFISSAAETIRQGGSNFGTTTFTGSGSWTYQDTHATTTGDFLITSGTVTAASGTITIGGQFVNQGTFTHNSGTLRFISSAASTSVTAGGSDLFATTFAGTGSFIFTNTNVALLDSLRIVQGSVTLASGTLSIGGSFLNTGGSFNHASGTILFNSSDTGESINPGSSLFNIVSIAAPSGGYTLTAHATTTSNFSLTSATVFTVQPGISLTVNGVFTNLVGGVNTTWTGSTLRLDGGVPYTINTKVAGGDFYNIIALNANTDVRMWDSGATTSVLDTQSSLYSQDNSSVNGELYIYGNYERTTGTDYWNYATDFDGTSLVGGSERIVTVRLDSGATTTISGGALQIIGAAGATTTVTNQTIGTYSLSVTGGTLYALNYALRNMDANGLSLSGNTTITSIANGDLELAVNGGSLMTVSSTTINYNASMAISGMRFATTSAITGVNVEVVGTTPSAWTFTNHRGNLDGESFDTDGGDACGSIRWTDSTCLLTQQSSFRWRNDDGGEGVPDSEWFDTDWSKRKRVTITNADVSTYTDAVVEVTVPYDGDMQADFDDLRFTDATGVTLLSYVREVYTASTEATVWVKVPTLTASADTEIYMYYGNGGVANGGVGTTTFIAYDDFEDANITEYSGETSKFTTNASFGYQGTYGLKAVVVGDQTTEGIHRTDITVSQGETIRFMQYVDTTSGSGDETCTLFGIQPPGNDRENYAVCLEQFGTDRVSIVEGAYDNDTNATVLASSTITYSTGWYEVEIDWGTDDGIAVSVYKDDVLAATTSVSNGAHTSGGIGFAFWFQNGGWDFYTSRPLLSSEPTTTLGYEQVRGGASWLAAVNTAAPGVDIGETVRPRFVIENTGLAVSDTYRLEYAPKGNAPSCEAVTSGSYSDVPLQSSCTGSPICMQSTAGFTNEASTIDLMGGTGIFTPGQIIEDPSNTTQSVAVDADHYTEVEYAVSITNDASDSNYCLRVTDGGTDLDSYARVAEIQLIFAPNITSLSLNGGLDINLYPGTTTRIYATGTITDLNGYADITTATTTLFRSDLSESCTADANNCYHATAPLCAYSNCSGNSCDITCSIDMYYHADPTDIDTYAGETWRALLAVQDQGGSVATATAPSVDLVTLRALSVDSSINYGALEANADTGSYNASTTFENIGNGALDVSIEGTDLTDGGASTIPVTTQRYATSTFTYSACVTCFTLSTLATNYELDLAKPTSTTPSVTDELFWGISVPFGVAGTPHHGSNTFYAISD